MSHSCAIVMVEDGFGEDVGLFTLKEQVAELLAPYGADIIVSPYMNCSERDSSEVFSFVR